MSTVIEVDDVWKKYRLGILGTGTLRHDFERWWHRIRGKSDPHPQVGGTVNRGPKVRRQNSDQSLVAGTAEAYSPNDAAELGDDEIWALRGVSFQVKQGEILGIIGRNGAGKSTLLKILSRVTSPTKGEVRMKGRIASLLEVGTGFHPELTGRENIFLNGAILGMTKAEIRTKLDEIIAFAEIDTYVDTPVKRYSSGMYVRLAFAVAAHVEPEILIVDEVLAVGDAQFQKKCLGKIGEVAHEGRTILFVSHNVTAVKSLCGRALLLANGFLSLNGPVDKVIEKYLGTENPAQTRWVRNDPVFGSDAILLQEIMIVVDGKQASGTICSDKPFEVVVRARAFREYRTAEISIRLTNQEGIPVLSTANCDAFDNFEPIERGDHVFVARFPAHLLSGGTYSLLVAALTPYRTGFDSIDGEVRLTIEEVGPQASVTRDGRLGVVNPRLDWRHCRQVEADSIPLEHANQSDEQRDA
jgi:lipopolysaccharide transport system ATP-binding protein